MDPVSKGYRGYKVGYNGRFSPFFVEAIGGMNYLYDPF